MVADWLSGNALVLINIVALRRARLVLGWVTVRGYTVLAFNQSHPSLFSLAITSVGRHNELVVVQVTAREEMASSV